MKNLKKQRRIQVIALAAVALIVIPGALIGTLAARLTVVAALRRML